MRHRIAGPALIGIAAIALAACSSTTGGSAAASASTAPAASAEAPSAAASEAAPSAAASEAASAAPSEAVASLAIPSFLLPSNAKELEALIPNTVCGAKVTKLSMKGSEVFTSGEDPTITAVLQSLGKTANEVSAAAGFDVSGGSQCGVFIFRIQGADEGKLRDIFKQLADKEGTKYTEVSLGGKTVAKMDSGDFQYVWVKGDGIISVTADSEAHAAEIIQQLP